MAEQGLADRLRDIVEREEAVKREREQLLQAEEMLRRVTGALPPRTNSARAHRACSPQRPLD